MALSRCVACNKNFSDTLAICPHCEAPEPTNEALQRRSALRYLEIQRLQLPSPVEETAIARAIAAYGACAECSQFLRDDEIYFKDGFSFSRTWSSTHKCKHCGYERPQPSPACEIEQCSNGATHITSIEGHWSFVCAGHGLSECEKCKCVDFSCELHWVSYKTGMYTSGHVEHRDPNFCWWLSHARRTAEKTAQQAMVQQAIETKAKVEGKAKALAEIKRRRQQGCCISCGQPLGWWRRSMARAERCSECGP